MWSIRAQLLGPRASRGGGRPCKRHRPVKGGLQGTIASPFVALRVVFVVVGSYCSSFLLLLPYQGQTSISQDPKSLLPKVFAHARPHKGISEMRGRSSCFLPPGHALQCTRKTGSMDHAVDLPCARRAVTLLPKQNSRRSVPNIGNRCRGRGQQTTHCIVIIPLSEARTDSGRRSKVLCPKPCVCREAS